MAWSSMAGAPGLQRASEHMSQHPWLQGVDAPNVSASISVLMPWREATLQGACTKMEPFGEIARLDTTLAGSTGSVVVTFFDVRCAERALQELGENAAVRFPSSPQDFRAVSISSLVCSELPPTFEGFHTFGDISNVYMRGLNMIVEFYDMRSAHHVILEVPEAKPHHDVSATVGSQVASLQACLTGMAEALFAPGLEPAAAQPQKVDGRFTYAPRTAPEVAAGPDAAPELPRPAKLVEGPPGLPVREKMCSKDLAKFDIVAERILSGEDTRTTVMVRNIPKSWSRDVFVDVLNSIESTNYSFFYMPFDKRRAIHCGFAFVDFNSPMDVLRLFEGLTEVPRAWDRLGGGGASKSGPPAVSYARLQGKEQLMDHFNTSAIMHDSDARKRPFFSQKGKVDNNDILFSSKEDETGVGPALVDFAASFNEAHLVPNGARHFSCPDGALGA
mmetsp:Transcript_21171/g.61094  ORF Transcript_21171/g.61094 Transcript_21171/m.61094 type:complete len:446 (+) Transcript_21171:57-1394(+)|eukprot:CAMPEP_0168430918 /NCGR_PEP_ID=MMETSP0228-20121227/38119_1 /TAXON_ID=133427 /ORGANISM="Protoceratium reticulatum, Strain CCCM 535 (=CCMP 1889)" /LENGTH=445 /DNA_ID=CAMNT_0008445021 /DNA_START=54 /DNA_END=1391 /DNA_ORIENTATION=-